MERFAYAKSKNVGHVHEQCAQGARIKAGGTELLAWMKRDLYAPERLVSIEGLEDIRGVRRDGDTLRIGAATRLSELASELGDQLPGLREATLQTATPGIRNLGTTAGNLLQENRCSYLHDRLITCRKKGDTELCPAERGPNAENAILGVQNCPSTNSSNLAPMLCALDARLVIAAKGKTRQVPLRELWQNETSRRGFAARLDDGEVVLAIELEPGELSTAHCEFRQKQSFDWPTATCAVALRLENERIEDIRIYLGAVAPVPYHAAHVEELLRGAEATETKFREAARAATKNAETLSDNAFKVAMAQHVCLQALKLAHQRARTG